MALTNRQRVEQALELLKTGLLPYVEREMKYAFAQSGNDADNQVMDLVITTP